MHDDELIHPLLSPVSRWVDPALEVDDAGHGLRFSMRDAFMHHGFDSPGGVALGWRLMQRAFALLSPGEPPERRAFTLFTSFPGMGLRDTVELVLRAVSGARFTLDAGYEDARAQEGVAGRFYYRFGYRGENVELAPLAGYPGDEFVRLGKASKLPGFAPEQAEQWTRAKFSLANTLLSAPAEAVIRTL